MTKAELIAKGKSLGLNLSMSALKADLETAVNNAEKAKAKAKPSPAKRAGEY